MIINEVLNVIGLLGIGAAISYIVQFILKKRELKYKTGHEFKETRYKALILLMYAMLDFEKEKSNLNSHGRNFQTKEQLLNEIKGEYHNMILFASDAVLKSVKAFIQNPIEEKFYVSALSMRKDLYGKGSKLYHTDLKL